MANGVLHRKGKKFWPWDARFDGADGMEFYRPMNDDGFMNERQDMASEAREGRKRRSARLCRR